MSAPPITVAAYVYPGWHACPERDLRPGWSEWELVLGARPRFPGHRQPRIPAWGIYDDSDPSLSAPRYACARAHGVDVLVFGLFWSSGKTVLREALDRGFLQGSFGSELPFALMWANRMPHRVLPLKAADPDGIDPARLVHSSPADFAALVGHLAERYFHRPNYWRLDGRPYLSIFDTTLFLRQLGAERAAEAIRRARAAAGDLHLAAIDPAPEWRGLLGAIGFDSATHYVYLPIWKGGPRIQDYGALAARRHTEWGRWAAEHPVPYFPSVSPGWDATPRGELQPTPRLERYPWSPVVTGESPERFEAHVAAAAAFLRGRPGAPLFVASLNEWSEGHYLEPDERFGEAFFEALGRGRGG